MSSKNQYIRPSRPEDWEPYRDTIEALYKENKLKDVMDTMEATYAFKATTRQYKIKIKEWGLDDKYIKTGEYLGILKVKRRREREDPNRDTVFWLRGKQVDPASITRFETRATKRGLIKATDTLSDKASLGDDLQYMTPTEDYDEDITSYDDYYSAYETRGQPSSSAYQYSNDR
ncbi:hypothetical protein MAPG_04446 [Magnaporthiopsis poae ATCC 64411]|uniref:Clr5 domain-containing protein n=1 Tax=Magnaporthiopsis poae (strain ATCC 64411 / 73-15) TaxID=644358 RepID=A0A0C4DWR6_MAGP6|nr:hypothetical protein MAPG_04446 [Magnaporthiopsis poae ATCC 64411]